MNGAREKRAVGNARDVRLLMRTFATRTNQQVSMQEASILSIP